LFRNPFRSRELFLAHQRRFLLGKGMPVGRELLWAAIYQCKTGMSFLHYMYLLVCASLFLEKTGYLRWALDPIMFFYGFDSKQNVIEVGLDLDARVIFHAMRVHNIENRLK
jgi:hypothetical protein